MENKNQTEMKGGKKDYEAIAQIVIIAVFAILIIYNGAKIYGIGSPDANAIATGIKTVSASEIIPKGDPSIYGEELGISFDDVSASNPQLADTTMAKLSKYEDMQLDSVQMERYVKIGSSIACEYCCGAKTLVFSNGERACGCAHSYAMRGLEKYLITKHPDMTDLEILNELGKWKVLFFPGVHEQKAQVLESQGIDSKNYVNLASNLYRGIEKGQASGGGMVGGC